MKIEEIKSIVDLMVKNDLSEFDIKAEDIQLCIKRGQAHSIVHHAAPATHAAQPPPTATPEVKPVEAQAVGQTIDSPIVGTFYRSPSPDAAPFVQVGDKVGPDTVVCIIEAMKVMNEIKARKTGKITKALVENQQAVEFGQPLFVIE